MMAEEDRISNLPDDIIHRILSFLDLKYAMQTSALSKKWKLVWTLLPQLNLDSSNFAKTSSFNKFVKHALLHRNNHREVSGLELRCRIAPKQQFTVRSIVNYACLHNVTRMTLVWDATSWKFPQYVFSCRALKDLTLAVKDRSFNVEFPVLGWDFPALEKLNLRNFELDGGKNKRINLFSKCVNLKDLTLHEIDMRDLEELTLCVPQLSNLSITFHYRPPKVLKVITHQLKNLTASIDSIHVLHCREGFISLEKVHLLLFNTCFNLRKEPHISIILGVLQKIHCAKFLILDADIIKVLSSCMDQLLLERCPFNNLECLKMNTMHERRYAYVAKEKHVVVPVQLKNYFLYKSPTATFITDYPQVPRKRPMQNVSKIKTYAECKQNKTIKYSIQREENVGGKITDARSS